MKRLLLFVTTLFVLASCKTSKDYLSRVDEDRTLFDVVKRLDKKSSDADALKALPEVYKAVQQKHLRKIASLQNSKELNRWDKLVEEYNALQNMYEAVNNVDAAARLVNATSYETEIYESKQNAAEAYYNEATALLQSNYRDDIKQSYNYFKKADKWVSGYKDARGKMDEAYQGATIDVLINPVQDNSFFFNTGWGNSGYNYSNEYFQQNLVRDLGSKYAARYPARFYTEWEARRDNVKPQWVVDLILRNLDMPRSTVTTSSRNVSKSIQIGTDTSGRAKYRTVTATLHYKTEAFTASVQMDVAITDVVNRKNISNNVYTEDYRWSVTDVSYTGDGEALSESDWAAINKNPNNNQPRKEQVLNELYRKIYPQVKNRISYAVDW